MYDNGSGGEQFYIDGEMGNGLLNGMNGKDNKGLVRCGFGFKYRKLRGGMKYYWMKFYMYKYRKGYMMGR